MVSLNVEPGSTVPLLPLAPSGRRGLILGEIFGRRAGLTRLVLTLFLFFGLRAIF